jgi:hypothetical protein
MRWKTFEQYKKRASALWTVTMPNDLSEAKWKAGTCTCPYLLKKYMCKHIIGLAIRLKAAKLPPAAIFLDYFWILFRYNISFLSK